MHVISVLHLKIAWPQRSRYITPVCTWAMFSSNVLPLNLPLTLQDPVAVTAVVAADSLASYSISILSGYDAKAAAGCESVHNGAGTSAHDAFLAPVLAVRELHQPQSDRFCLHVELDTRGSRIQYEAGDHVGVYTENSDAVVQQAAALLGLPLDTVFSLSLPEGNPHQLAVPQAGGQGRDAAHCLALHCTVSCQCVVRSEMQPCC